MSDNQEPNEPNKEADKVVDEFETIIAAMKETAAYRQYIEDEINLRLNGEGLGEPIGLLKADKLARGGRE